MIDWQIVEDRPTGSSVFSTDFSEDGSYRVSVQAIDSHGFQSDPMITLSPSVSPQTIRDGLKSRYRELVSSPSVGFWVSCVLLYFIHSYGFTRAMDEGLSPDPRLDFIQDDPRSINLVEKYRRQ